MSALKIGTEMTPGTSHAHSVDHWVNLKLIALASYPLTSSAFQGAGVGMRHRKEPGIYTAVLVDLSLGQIICLSHSAGKLSSGPGHPPASGFCTETLGIASDSPQF